MKARAVIPLVSSHAEGLCLRHHKLGGLLVQRSRAFGTQAAMQSSSGQSTPLNGSGNGLAASAWSKVGNHGQAKPNRTQRTQRTCVPPPLVTISSCSAAKVEPSACRNTVVPRATCVTFWQMSAGKESGQVQDFVMSAPWKSPSVLSQWKLSLGSGTLS